MIDYARHEALARRPAKDGAPTRAYWEASAKKGNAEAIARLTGPPEPDALRYLYDWSLQLHGRSGATMDALAPLSYPALQAWAGLADVRLAPHEMAALIALDDVMRHPDLPVEAE